MTTINRIWVSLEVSLKDLGHLQADYSSPGDRFHDGLNYKSCSEGDVKSVLEVFVDAH